jgi:epoxyqueuosine reductase
MDQLEFSNVFSGSPIKRTKRSGLLRNASVILGNHADTNSIHTLTTSLIKDPDPIVRSHCAWALGQIGHTEVVSWLEYAQENESDTDVLVEIKYALDVLSNQNY